MVEKIKKTSKQRAGALLSGFLRNIAEEETELCKDIDGNNRMITKAEALARLVWKKALGYTETIVNDKGIESEITHFPDRVYATMLFDRLEGKVAAVDSGKKDKRKISDKVGEQSKNRLNKMAEDSVASN